MLAAAMSDTSSVRMMVREYFFYNGEFPEGMVDLKLDAKEMVSRHVRSLQIESGGAIVILLPESVGAEGREMHVKLTPEMVMGGQKIQWNCSSNLPSKVLNGGPCEAI